MAIVIGRIPPAPAQPHPRLVRLGREVGAEFPALSPVAPRHRCYLYHFTGSFDEPRDVEILKELVYWASIHQDDCLLRVVHAAPGLDDAHQKAFGVTESPCLVLSDSPELPASHVKLGNSFFASNDYSALRNLLETLRSGGMEGLVKLTVSPQPS